MSRFDKPWPYSCAMISLSRSLSRFTDAGRLNVMFTTPCVNRSFKVLPLASEIITAGIVMAASAPPIEKGASPTFCTITTAMAPAFCALSTFVVKLQVPRSIKAILPATAAPLVTALHTCVGCALPSSACTNSPVQKPCCAPKPATTAA